jgi:fused signal recognition particle receptor
MSTVITINDPEIPLEITQDVVGSFSDLASRFSTIMDDAASVLRKNPDSDEVATEARACRLQMVRIRTDTERKRKELLKPIDLRRKAINGAAAIFQDRAAIVEGQLRPIEDAAEARKEAKRKELHESRLAKISELLSDESLIPYTLMDLGDKSNKEFDDILTSAKELHSFLAAKREEEERAAAEAQRLLAEAEAQRQAEEAEAARVRAEQEAQRQAEEAEAARVRAEQEAQRQAEEAEAARVRAEQEAQRQAELEEAKRVAAEREVENAKLREQLEASQRKDREEREAREAEAARVRAEQEANRLRELERQAQEVAAAKEIALAPDREKLLVFLNGLKSAITAPDTMVTPSGKSAALTVQKVLDKAIQGSIDFVKAMR